MSTKHRRGVCRICGCTETDACRPTCEWTDEKHTLCTCCADARDIVANSHAPARLVAHLAALVKGIE